MLDSDVLGAATFVLSILFVIGAIALGIGTGQPINSVMLIGLLFGALAVVWILTWLYARIVG